MTDSGSRGVAASVQAKLRQAMTLHQQGLLGQARDLYEAILKVEPGNRAALQLLAVIYAQSKTPHFAVELFDRVLAVAPDDASAHYNRGIVLHELRRWDEALIGYERAIAIKPDYAEAYNNRGATLQKLERLEDALASFDHAIAIRPTFAGAHSNRGLALRVLRQPHAAIASFDRAIVIDPRNAEAYNNKGVALQDLRQWDAAIACYDRAIAIKPDYAEARWNKSLTLLLQGDFERGFELYESRWDHKGLGLNRPRFGQPAWRGTESLVGKSIFVYAEQGLGDTIQFSRYAKLLADQGARVLLGVPEQLAGLLQGLEGVAEIIVDGSSNPEFDFHCPLLSLPLAFKTTWRTIPNPGFYLHSDERKRQSWSERLGPKTKSRIGVVWSGNANHNNDRNRSFALSSLLPYLTEECEYVSLQKEIRERDASSLSSSSIRHFGDDLHDFTDTAALCDLMDLVISVDTSLVHLSGALGKRTLVLLPYLPDWRWMLAGDESPWYASIKLYRQSARMDWCEVFERIRGELTCANR